MDSLHSTMKGRLEERNSEVVYSLMMMIVLYHDDIN